MMKLSRRGLICIIGCGALIVGGTRASPAADSEAKAAPIVSPETAHPVDSPEALSQRAAAALQREDYDTAIELLRRAIHINPGDLGDKFDPWSLPAPDEAAMKHARHQFERMLIDRPLMGTHLRASDDIRKWALRQFAKKLDGGVINWDRTPTAGNAGAMDLTPWHGRAGWIQVDDIAGLDNDSAFETLWYRMVFELLNIEGSKETRALDYDTWNRKTSEQDYVKGYFLYEYGTLERTRKWYVEVFLPHAKRNQLPTNPNTWFCGNWTPPAELFARCTDKNAYPWKPYSAYYRAMTPASRTNILGGFFGGR